MCRWLVNGPFLQSCSRWFVERFLESDLMLDMSQRQSVALPGYPSRVQLSGNWHIVQFRLAAYSVFDAFAVTPTLERAASKRGHPRL